MRLNGALFLRGGQDVVRLRVDRQARDLAFARTNLAGERINLANRFHLAAPQLDAHGKIVIRRIDFDHIATNAERAAAQIFGALVLDFDELAQDGFARDLLALFKHQHHPEIRLGRADAINAGDGGDDDHVAALEERAGGAHAELVELVVDRGFFFDEGVARRDVGLRLVIIVVAHEVLDGVLRKERLELVEELRGERLIVGEDDRGAIELLDHFRHRESFSRAGNAEEDLVTVAIGQPANELRDSFRLVASGFVVTG